MDSNLQKLCAERLDNVLKQKKIRQVDIAKELNLTPQHINYMCKGTRQISYETAYKISRICCVRMEYLLGLDDIITQPTIRDFTTKELLQEIERRCN